MVKTVFDRIIAIIMGFALIAAGVGAITPNFIVGVGLIVAGLAAIAMGFDILK